MIWYAFEIILALIWLFVCFLIYRVLVNSPRFTRFIERTLGTDESSLEDAAAKLDVAEARADQTADHLESKIERQAAALRSYDRRRGS